MGNHKFIDIEDFQSAYEERLKTFFYLMKQDKDNDNDNDNKIMIMHLGGIIIECYLKALIVEKNKITKRIGHDIWSNEQQVSEIDSNHQIKRSKIIDSNLGIKNPGHDIINAYKQLDEIKDLISSNEDLTKKFEYIQNPLKKENTNFIDLRYSIKSDFNDISQEFNEWKNSFKEIYNWLNRNRNIIEV